MAPKLQMANIKKLLVEKGEMVGLIAAGAIALLFSIIALVMTVRAESPAGLSKNLQKQAQEVDNKLKKAPAVPVADWLPKTNPNQQAAFRDDLKIDLPTRFHYGQVFASAFPVDDKATQPRVFPFGEKLARNEEYREGRCYFEYAQVRSYNFTKEGEYVDVLESKDGKDVPRLSGNYNQRAQPGRPGGQAIRPGGPQRNAGLPTAQPPGAEGVKDSKVTQVKIEDLPNKQGYKLAEKVLPVRMGIIVASFPYRLQLKEFWTALYTTPEAMLEQTMLEPVLDKNGKETFDKDGKKITKELPAFRFKGVIVQRRQVDALGNPITQGPDGKALPEGWYDIQLEDAYRGYIYDSGKRTMSDPPDLDPVLIDGLTMPRLLEMRDHNYTPFEKDLTHIKTAIKPFLENKDKPNLRPKEFQQDDDFNPFQRPTSTERPPGPDGRPGGPLTGTRPPPGGKNIPGTPRPSDPTPTKALDPVQYCLIRLIDVTNLEPGKNYEYRIKVRMANPNFGKPLSQVANPKDAEELELVSREWYPIPGRLVVPAEYGIYAVDQAVLDNQPKRSTNDYNKNISTVLQFHRWVDFLPNGGFQYAVGEWSVAERVIVNRGEIIDRSVKVLIPCWKTSMEAFILVGSTAAEADKFKGAEVIFGSTKDKDQRVLLDFDNGDLSYARGKDKSQTIRETGRGEVLILTPDGRIQAHDTVTDAESKERKDRYKEYRDRIEEVRTGAKASPVTDPNRPVSPFGPGR